MKINFKLNLKKTRQGFEQLESTQIWFQQLSIEAEPKNTFIIAMHATPFISSYIKGEKACYQYYPMQKIMLKISQF